MIDVTATEQLAETIRETDASLADGLTILLREYRFDVLQELCRDNDEEEK